MTTTAKTQKVIVKLTNENGVVIGSFDFHDKEAMAEQWSFAMLGHETKNGTVCLAQIIDDETGKLLNEFEF